MDIKDIEIGEQGKNLEYVLKAVKALPNLAIKGISGYGHFTARVKGERIVMQSESNTSRDDLTIDMPRMVKSFHCERDENGSYVLFCYNGIEYQIYF